MTLESGMFEAPLWAFKVTSDFGLYSDRRLNEPGLSTAVVFLPHSTEKQNIRVDFEK